MLVFVTCDVFTDQPFGGNPLAVVFGAEGLSTEQLQKIAFEFNYSETTFVLPPKDQANTANVRIFTPGYEMSFAGHPNVGTGYVLARMGELFGKKLGDQLLFEELAGLVTIDIQRDGAGNIAGTRVAAPKLPGEPVPMLPDTVARAVGLTVDDLDMSLDPPVLLEAGPTFAMVRLNSHEALKRATIVDPSVPFPDGLAEKGVGLLLYTVLGEADPLPVASRMMALDAAMSGLTEDPATGSASVILASYLQRRDPHVPTRLTITQGVEMGRPSTIETEVVLNPDGSQLYAAVSGKTVIMMEGKLLI